MSKAESPRRDWTFVPELISYPCYADRLRYQDLVKNQAAFAQMATQSGLLIDQPLQPARPIHHAHRLGTPGAPFIGWQGRLPDERIGGAVTAEVEESSTLRPTGRPVHLPKLCDALRRVQ
jgi:hypothetical protein